MDLLLCSIGGESRGVYFNNGLIFLSYLIGQRFPSWRMRWIRPTDLSSIKRGDADVLLISLLSVLSVPTLFRSLKGRRPKIRTIIGGPGAIVCGVLRHFADAVIVGRGEDSIFRALAGDYAGLAIPGPTLANNTVEIFPPSLLSWDDASCGCGCKCNFCTCGWMNTYARWVGDTSSQGYIVSVEKPTKEKLLAEITAEDVRRTPPPPKQLVAGLDGLSALDLYLVRKPISWQALEKWAQNLGESFGRKESLCRNIRLYTIVNYPWHAAIAGIEELFDLQKVCIDSRSHYPHNVRIMLSVGMQPFVPSLFTPMEREPCSLRDPRSNLKKNCGPCGFARPRGLRLDISPMTQPSPLGAVIETILGRTEDPAILADLARHTNLDYLGAKYEHLLRRTVDRPQPWVRRPNDYSYREYAYYRDLFRLGFIDEADFRRMAPADVPPRKIDRNAIRCEMLPGKMRDAFSSQMNLFDQSGDID